MRMLRKLMKNNLLLFYSGCIIIYIVSTTYAYPVESKPLNNNPETWFGDEWLVFSPQGSEKPSSSALIGYDPHVKKSKITPKSIFIAPNTINHEHHHNCPSGYRIDLNRKCIKVVKINQDELLAARISELFGVDDNTEKGNSDAFADYYDTDDESSKKKNISTSSGPLQINIPITIDLEDDNNDSEKHVEYIIIDKVTDIKDHDVVTTPSISPSQFTERASETLNSVTPSKEDPITENSILTTTEETTTSIVTDPETTTTFNPTTESGLVDTITEETFSTSSYLPTTEVSTPAILSTTTTTTSTQKPLFTTKTFSVDFLPKTYRKSTNRQQSISSHLKNYRERIDKADRSRKYNITTITSIKPTNFESQFGKFDTNLNSSKKSPTRNYLKRPNNNVQSTTEKAVISTTTTSYLMAATTVKPFWWLPRGWSVQESKDNPVLIRFWSQQPLIPDGGGTRSHTSRQRANSRMPSDNIFREISLTEIDKMLKEK